MIDRPEAEALDLSDPLASFRDRFVIPDPGRIYLDGNSLGRLSIDVQRGIRNVVDAPSKAGTTGSSSPRVSAIGWRRRCSALNRERSWSPTR
jgi:kynureninase